MMKKTGLQGKSKLFGRLDPSLKSKKNEGKDPVIPKEETERTELQVYIDTQLPVHHHVVSEIAPIQRTSIKRESSPSLKRNITQPLNSVMWAVSKDVWARHILSRASSLDVRMFAQSCRAARQLVDNYINIRFQFSRLDTSRLLKQAHMNGVKLNLPLLHRLCNVHFSFDLFYSLQLEQNASWAIAAICGDISWLEKHHGNDLKRLCTKNSDSNKGILFFLTIGNQLDIIKLKFHKVVQFYSKKPIQLQQLNYFAGKLGHFDICDFLEINYGVMPNERFLNNECTLHWYAYYGQTFRLMEALEKFPEIGNLLIPKRGYLVHYATEGGQTETVKMLAKKFPEKFKEATPTYKITCVHIAARFGHAALLKYLIEELRLNPLAISESGFTPLHECSSVGRWDCIWVLMTYYRSLPNFREILNTVPHLAVGQNHIEFLTQFVNRFGTAWIHTKSPNGDPLSFQLYISKSMTTARILVNDYGLDLTAKNTNGVTALLFIAKMTIHHNIQTLWSYIADLLNEFNGKFDNQLHLISDNQGTTLESLIIKENKQECFPKLVFSAPLSINQ